MKKCVVVRFALVLCLVSVAFTQPARAADPGSRYSDAFVLIQQGQAAEEKSDLATAYHRYQDALNVLHSIRTDSPDWNAQMVEYRLKDCQSHFDAVKTKLPEPPPVPAAETPTVVTPAVTVSTAKPAAPAPVLKPADDQATKSALQINTLQKENNDLKAKLATAEKQAATAKPTDTAQLKKLRADADSARAEADKAKKEAADLETKTADLSKQVAAAKKSASQVADLQKQNQDLSAQLAAA